MIAGRGVGRGLEVDADRGRPFEPPDRLAERQVNGVDRFGLAEAGHPDAHRERRGLNAERDAERGVERVDVPALGDGEREWDGRRLAGHEADALRRAGPRDEVVGVGRRGAAHEGGLGVGRGGEGRQREEGGEGTHG